MAYKVLLIHSLPIPDSTSLHPCCLTSCHSPTTQVFWSRLPGLLPGSHAALHLQGSFCTQLLARFLSSLKSLPPSHLGDRGFPKHSFRNKAPEPHPTPTPFLLLCFSIQCINVLHFTYVLIYLPNEECKEASSWVLLLLYLHCLKIWLAHRKYTKIS